MPTIQAAYHYDYHHLYLYCEYHQKTMSVELLSECKRKLTNALSKLDKTVQMFDSEPLERCFY
jgi:hypothetical protein